MHYTFKSPEFEGPLELLLTLIENEKLDITTISLAKVTDQYLAYIEHEQGLPPDEVADFLVVAAKLIYIKSKYLLPELDIEEEDGEDLERQLRMYREYYNASKGIAKMLGKKKFSYIRSTTLKLKREAGFSPPTNLHIQDLPGIFSTILKQLETIVKLPRIILKATVSIREKIKILKESIQKGILQFHRTYDGSNKQDMIVSFLALLELVKMRDVSVEQQGLFAEIVIKKVTSYE